MAHTRTDKTSQAVLDYIAQHELTIVPTEQLFERDGESIPLVLHFLEFNSKTSRKFLKQAFTLPVDVEIKGDRLTCPSPYEGGTLSCVRGAFGDGTYVGTPDYTVDGLYYLGQHRCFFAAAA